jgi:hypothetical protein
MDSIPGDLPTLSTLRYSETPNPPKREDALLSDPRASVGTESTPRHFWHRKLALFSQPVTTADSHCGSLDLQKGHLGSLLSMYLLGALSVRLKSSPEMLTSDVVPGSAGAGAGVQIGGGPPFLETP